MVGRLEDREPTGHDNPAAVCRRQSAFFLSWQTHFDAIYLSQVSAGCTTVIFPGAHLFFVSVNPFERDDAFENVRRLTGGETREGHHSVLNSDIFLRGVEFYRTKNIR